MNPYIGWLAFAVVSLPAGPAHSSGPAQGKSSPAAFVGTFEGTKHAGAHTKPVVLQLESDHGAIAGRYCKGGGRNCKDLEAVVIDRNHILASMTFEDPAPAPSVGKAMYRALFSLDLSQDGRTMSGTAFSTKCNCTESLVLAKASLP